VSGLDWAIFFTLGDKRVLKIEGLDWSISNSESQPTLRCGLLDSFDEGMSG
jgi:hypothetical protein